MVRTDQPLLREVVRRIAEAADPERIILFGSRARGGADAASDIDILVIADSPRPRHERSAPLYGVLSDIPVPMDILVYSPQEVDEWREVPQAFVTTAVREGKLLYERG